MAKKSFLKKGALKTLPTKAIHAGERVIGAGVAGFASKKILGDKVNEKYHGLILMAVGLAGEAFVETPHLNSIAQGMTVMGGLKAVKTLMPEEAANLGLGEAEFTDYEELEGLDDDTPAELDDDLVAGLEEAVNLLNGTGVYTPEDMAYAETLSGRE